MPFEFEFLFLHTHTDTHTHFASCNEFARTPVLALLDGSVKRIAYSEYARTNTYREHTGIQECCSAVMFVYMGAARKWSILFPDTAGFTIRSYRCI
jgi:hypothetical protein